MAMEFWTRLQQFGVVRLAIIIGASLGVAAILGFVALRPPSGDYGVLYANLDYANGQSVIDRLEADNTPYRLREAGGRVTILAPRGVIAPLRIDLAADGVITASGVGYEIFDETDALGATAFQQNINRLRALEGELARTIASIAGVRSARVHLVLPERALFARERTPASASIMVEAPAGLEPRAVRAITNLVASAVPELTAGQVTVLDASGALLSAAQDENGVFLNSIEEKTAATQTRLRRTVEDIVGRIVGPDNVRVQVAAELDLNRVTENAEIIDPDSQTVLSETVVEEASNDSRPGAANAVTVANALPGADEAGGATTPGAASSNRRTEETTNYEISKTIRSAVREQGGVKRLSVAVALNAADTPRGPQEIAAIEGLVRSAVGFDAARGDQISIAEMAFSPALAPTQTAGATAQSPLGATPINIGALAQYGALAAVALALIIFVIRPALAPMAGGAAGSIAAQSAGAGVSRDQNGALAPTAVRASEGGSPLSIPDMGESEIDRRIDLAQVEGQVKASSLRKVSELVKSHADESSGIVKSWIREAV